MYRTVEQEDKTSVELGIAIDVTDGFYFQFMDES